MRALSAARKRIAVSEPFRTRTLFWLPQRVAPPISFRPGAQGSVRAFPNQNSHLAPTEGRAPSLLRPGSARLCPSFSEPEFSFGSYEGSRSQPRKNGNCIALSEPPLRPFRPGQARFRGPGKPGERSPENEGDRRGRTGVLHGRGIRGQVARWVFPVRKLSKSCGCVQVSPLGSLTMKGTRPVVPVFPRIITITLFLKNKEFLSSFRQGEAAWLFVT